MLINSPEEMMRFGEKLALSSKVILLEGDLGAGKTVLTKGFAIGLGIAPDIVQSPTYAYMNVYANRLLHIDMYRIDTYEDLVEKGIIDQISQFDYIVIERPKFVDRLGLKQFFKITIKKHSDWKRIVSVQENE